MNGEFGDRLGRDVFAQPTLVVARSLLGAVLQTSLPDGRTSGRIVEVEGYLDATDLASHAARLKRGRVESMSGLPGIAYVYRSMGIHAMLNIVTEPSGRAGAVLIRAVEPIAGVDLMRRRRGLDDPRLLCAGPGRLCQAFGISLDDHGRDVTTSDHLAMYMGGSPASISASGRIGISRAMDAPYRFFETGSAFVSAHRRGTVLTL